MRIRDRVTEETRTLDADLVVDALGRGSVSPKWLAGWGYGDVAETSVRVDVGYATAVFERRAGVAFVRADDLPEGGVDPDSVRALIEKHKPKSPRFW